MPFNPTSDQRLVLSVDQFPDSLVFLKDRPSEEFEAVARIVRLSTEETFAFLETAMVKSADRKGLYFVWSESLNHFFPKYKWLSQLWSRVPNRKNRCSQWLVVDGWGTAKDCDFEVGSRQTALTLKKVTFAKKGS